MEYALPHKAMRHTRSSALRYQKQQAFGRRERAPQSQRSQRSQQGSQHSQRSQRSSRRDSRAAHAKTAPLPGIHVQPTIMSLNEFGHVVNMANRHQQQEPLEMKRDQLRQRSKARYQNWGNTLEALRERKKNNRVKRMEEVERRQQVIDEQEADYQEGLRRAAIERANQILYTQNDRVKNFQKGLIYSNVLKAREAQIRIKAREKQAEETEEQKWFLRQMDELKVKIEQEKKDDLVRKSKSQKISKMQLQQLAERRAHNIRCRQEEIQEGDRIKAAAAQALEQAKMAARARNERMKENQLEYQRANEMQKRLKEEQARLDQLEEEQLIAMHKEKERKAADRKRIEAEKKAKKAAVHEAMLQKQYDYLLSLKNEEEARLANEAAELEAKTEMFAARKEKRRLMDLQATQLSRKRQIETRKLALDRQREENMILSEHWERRRLEMEKLDLDNERKTIEHAKELKTYLRHQINQKETAARKRREDELAFMQYQNDLRRREDAVFNEYTRAHIVDYRNRGQSTKPMEILLVKEQIRNIRAV